MEKLHLEFSTKHNIVPVVVEACASYAKNLQFSDAKIRSIELCVDEAINNAMVFGDASESLNSNIELYLEVIENFLVVSIIDYGLPGDFEETLKNDDKWGCEIIESLMDYYDVINLGANGRKQEMKLSLEHDLSFDEQIIRSAEDTSFRGPIIYRKMNLQDALEVCRGIYKVYGFSYFITDNYYPEFFEKMILNKKLYGFIAEDSDGNLASFVAFKKLDNLPGVWEACAGYTLKKYRGNDIFETLTAFGLNDIDVKENCKVIFGDATTVHINSQLPLIKLGFSFTGFTFNEKPGSAYRMDVGIDNAARLSYATYFLINKKKADNIYVPAEIEDIIKSYIDNLELNREMNVSSEIATRHLSEFSQNIDSRAGYSLSLFKSIGDDYKQALFRIDYDAKTKLISTSDILLPLREVNIETLYKYAREKGYFFTEYIPQTEYGDLIKMQRFYTGTINFDKIKLPESVKPYLEKLILPGVCPK